MEMELEEMDLFERMHQCKVLILFLCNLKNLYGQKEFYRLW